MIRVSSSDLCLTLSKANHGETHHEQGCDLVTRQASQHVRSGAPEFMGEPKDSISDQVKMEVLAGEFVLPGIPPPHQKVQAHSDEHQPPVIGRIIPHVTKMTIKARATTLNKSKVARITDFVRSIATSHSILDQGVFFGGVVVPGNAVCFPHPHEPQILYVSARTSFSSLQSGHVHVEGSGCSSCMFNSLLDLIQRNRTWRSLR